MSFHEVDFTITGSSREKMRNALISAMLEEEHGSGKGTNSSRYQYNVENYNGYIIYLKRPTRLNKGFDFTVNIQGLYFKKNRKYSNPSHQDIFNILNRCKSEFPDNYAKIAHIILQLYHCKEPDLDSIKDITFTDFEGNNHPIAIILLIIKWLFMEQDCAYWNYSGRDMLFSALAEKSLV